MPDNLKRVKPQDSRRINLNQPYEVKYWARILGISEIKLPRIIGIVGTNAGTVRLRLRLDAAKQRFLRRL